MRHKIYLIIIIGVLAGLLAGCGDGKTVRHIPHQGDTPYQADSILVTYGTNPQRALVLLDSAFALYSFRQKHIMSAKNRVLVRMINEKMTQPKELKVELGADAELFKAIDTAIRSERLYAYGSLQRQTVCDRFGISRHVLNAVLAEYAEGLSFPQYINNIRLDEALRMLRGEPEKTIATIAAEVGFTPANLREQFKRCYGVTPVEYRAGLVEDI